MFLVFLLNWDQFCTTPWWPSDCQDLVLGYVRLNRRWTSKSPECGLNQELDSLPTNFFLLVFVLLKLVFRFSLFLGPTLHLLVGSPASVSTLFLTSWDWIDVEQAEFFEVVFIGSQILLLQFLSLIFFACGWAFQKLLSLLRCHENNNSLSKSCVFFVLVCFLSSIFELFLLEILGPVGDHVPVVGPVTRVYKSHKLRAPKTQYNDLVFYSCRLGLQLTNISDNLDFIYFYNMGHKWFQSSHCLFHLWFQAIHSLGHSWVQVGYILVHLWFQANHRLVHLW